MAATRRPVRFDGQSVVITGAGNGLGRAFALDVAARGGMVVVNDNGRDPEGRWFADVVVDEISAAGGVAVASHHSVAGAESAVGIVDTALDAYGRVDALINNAGNNHWSTFEDTDLDLLEAMLWVHLKGHFLLTQRAYVEMARRGSGRVVFVSSTSGLFGREYGVAYAAAKTGMVGLMNVVAIEGASKGVRANALLPEGLGTAIQSRTIRRGSAPALQFAADDSNPRAGVAFVAPLATYLASDQCQSTHGIYAARLGCYSRIFVGAAPGWLAEGGSARTEAPTAEDIAAHWDEVCDPAGLAFPVTAGEEHDLVAERLRADT